MPPYEVDVALTINDDGSCSLQLQEMPSIQPDDATATLSTKPNAHSISLVQSLMSACHPDALKNALNEAWTASEKDSEPGTFRGLNSGEVLLNAVPLFQKVLSCLACASTDLHSAFICADFLGKLCLDEESSLLLLPQDVLTTVRRLIAAKRRETREGALRCITLLIKGNKEYCQSFLSCDVMDFILDQIDYENETEVADYACKSVLSLVHYLTDDSRLESLLSRVVPSLIRMLSDETDLDTKLNALRCLVELRHIESVASKLQEDAVVTLLAPLLRTEHSEIKSIAIELFGKHLSDANSEGLSKLSPSFAFALLKEIFEEKSEGLEMLRLKLLECLLGGVHCNTFSIQTTEAQFLSDIILKDTIACASKAVDILVVAWDMHESMADDLAKSDGFLSQLPHVMSTSQAALHIMHSMFHSDVDTSHAMAQNLGRSELERLRNEMRQGSSEVKMIVLDCFMKLIEQENRCEELMELGLLEDLVDWFDSECLTVRKRCWKMCAMILEINPMAPSSCVELGLVRKYESIFVDLLEKQKLMTESNESNQGLRELFVILKAVSEIKPGARAINDSGILSRLLEYITPNGIVCEHVRDIVMNVLTALPVTTSRLIAQTSGFDVLSELIQKPDLQLKRLGFEILKLISFKECSSYLTDTTLVQQLCKYFHDPNPNLKKDAVVVICKMARSALDEVVVQVAQSGSSSSLWSASRELQDGDETKILWKIFQGIRSLEASAKAKNKRFSRSVSSRTNSFCSFSAQDHKELLADLRGMKRGQSFSVSSRTGRSVNDSQDGLSVASSKGLGRKMQKASSTVTGYFRKKKTRPSDLTVQKEEAEQPSRLEKLKSFPGLRKGKKTQS